MLVFRFSRASGKFEISGISGTPEHPRGCFRPPVDISYRNREFIVRMDIPGMDPDDITIEVGESEINITGNVQPRNPAGPCRLMERPSGPFIRTLDFSGNIEPDKVTAVLTNGVLTLKVPAPNLERNPTKIEIRINGAD